MQAPVFEVTEAISYKRFSSGRQAKGNSLARQTGAEERYAAAHGLRIMDTYLDAGVSGYRGTNADLGALRRLVRLAQSGKFKRGTPLLVESLDRLSRQAAWRAHRLFSDLILAGLVVVTVSDEQVYSEKSLDEDPMRFMFSIVIMIRANDESRQKSNRSRDNRARERERIRTHKVLTGRTKAWVDRGPDGKPKPNHHAAAVLRIYEDAARGYGAMKIAARLSEEGYPTFKGGKHWSPASVVNILRDDAVLGYFQPHRYERLPGGRTRRVPEGEPVEGYYPVVVPPPLVQRAREGLANRRNARGRSGPTWANLVKGLCRCNVCGGKVHYFERVRDYPYLRCYAATGIRACDNHIGFRYDLLEPLLLKLYETHIAVSEILPKAPDKAAAQLAELEVVASRLEERIERLVDDLENTPVGPAKEAVERRLAQRNAELVQMRHQIRDAQIAVRASDAMIDEDVEARFNAAIAKMNAPDVEVRRNARREVAAQYQRVIEQITLYEDRTLTIEMKPRDGIEAVYRLNSHGLIEAAVYLNGWIVTMMPDGQWCFHEPPDFAKNGEYDAHVDAVIEAVLDRFEVWTAPSDSAVIRLEDREYTLIKS
jgi:DNA invertase Pin-like site-specific DNA recombinase